MLTARTQGTDRIIMRLVTEKEISTSAPHVFAFRVQELGMWMEEQIENRKKSIIVWNTLNYNLDRCSQIIDIQQQPIRHSSEW